MRKILFAIVAMFSFSVYANAASISVSYTLVPGLTIIDRDEGGDFFVVDHGVYLRGTISPAPGSSEGYWTGIKVYRDGVPHIFLEPNANGYIDQQISSYYIYGQTYESDGFANAYRASEEALEVLGKTKYHVRGTFNYYDTSKEPEVFDWLPIEEAVEDDEEKEKAEMKVGAQEINVNGEPVTVLDGITQAVRNSTVDPIEIATGNMYINASDISVPGFGQGLNLSRMYNSQDDTVGFLGHGWRTNYDSQLVEESDGTIKEYNSAGALTIYTLEEDSSYSTSVSKFSTLLKNGDGTYTITSKGGESQVYNDEGKLIQFLDRNGNTLDIEYDLDGNMISVSDQAARKIEFAIVDGKIAEARDPAGKITSYTYDADNNLIMITDPAGNEIHYVYDANHNIIEMTNANGNKTYYEYDSEDRAVANWQDGDINKETLSFDSDTQTTLTDANGNQTVYEFNEYGVTTKITYADGAVIEYVYNEDMQKEAIVDVYGNRTEFTYDANKNLSQIIDAKGNVTNYLYDSTLNKILSVTDVLGNLTSYDYDVNGNLIKVTDALSNVTEYGYDAQGNRITVTNAKGTVTNFEYDEFANLIKIIDAQGNETEISYDASGNPLTITDAKSNVTTNVYDDLNRLKEVYFADATNVNFDYDAFGNKIGVIDQLGRVTNFDHDIYERNVSMVNALGNTVDNVFDARGNLVSVTDQNANVTSLSYDSLNRLTQETTALGNQTIYTYDLLGRVSTKQSANGDSIEFAYDELGNLVSKVYSDSRLVNYSYDELGRLVSMEDWTGITSYAYNALGRLLELDGPEIDDTISYEYDELGNKIAMTDQNGKRYDYTYDLLNRLVSVEDEKGLTTFTYDGLSNVTAVVYPTGASIEKSYDSMGRVLNVSNKDAAGSVISSFDHEYNAAGMLIKKTLSNGAWIEYQYDDIDQLIRETKKKTKKDGSEKVVYDNEYSYDAAGNRTGFAKNISVEKFWEHERPNLADQVKEELTAAGHGEETADLPLSFKKAYVYDADNQLNSWTRNIEVEDSLININEFTYTYDANGNRTSKTLSKIDVEEPFVTNYTYDIENRLTELEYINRPNEKGVTSAIFEYNSNGQRIKSIEHKPTKTNTTKYYYDGLNVIIERDQADLSQKSYTRAPGYGGGIAGLISMNIANGNSFYYHYDAQGSVVNLTNKQGKKVINTNYDAYGRKKGKKGSWKNNNYRFSSKEHEPHANLYYYGARYYDPQTGRWLTRDPMGFIDGPNVYAYVTNNPVNYVDYYGYSAQMIGGFGTTLPIPVGYNPPVLPNFPDFNSSPKKKQCSGGVEKKQGKGQKPPHGKWWGGLPGKEKAKGGRPRKSEGKGRKKKYYEWDPSHGGEVEGYDRHGNHTGVHNPETGDVVKPARPGRTIPI